MNKIKKDEHVNTYIDGVLLVEKGHDDHWTTSTKFKQDLVEVFKHGYDDKVCLELGSHRGYTSKLLSRYFSKVIAVDNDKDFQDFAKQYWNSDNIEYHLKDIYKDEWSFINCDPHVVYIDCVNDYDHRKRDIDRCINYFSNPLLIITDYGLFPGVKQIVDEYVDMGKLVIERTIGMPVGTHYPRCTQQKFLLDWEGVICSTPHSEYYPTPPENNDYYTHNPNPSTTPAVHD